MFKRLIKKIFRCPLDRNLIIVWRVKKHTYAIGQIETQTKIKIGSYVLIGWTTFYTDQSDWVELKVENNCD